MERASASFACGRKKDSSPSRHAEKAANLPEQMVQNIAKGRLNKFFKESCLVDQEFQFGDGDKLNVAQWLQAQSKTLAVCDYRRYSLSAE